MPPSHNPKAQGRTVGKTPQRWYINKERPNRVPQQPRLLLLPVLFLRLLLSLDTLNPSSFRHPLDGTSHQRHKGKVPCSKDSSIGVPVADVARLESGMRLQPSGSECAGGGGCESHPCDQGGAEGEGVVPESREGFAGNGGVGAEEGEEDGELVEREAEGYGGGAEGEDEAEVAASWFESFHCCDVASAVFWYARPSCW